jgi:DNA-binding protein H-NS
MVQGCGVVVKQRQCGAAVSWVANHVQEPPKNVKTPEQEAALRSIRKLIDFWQIAPEELIMEGAPEPLPVASKPVTIKYRHPVSQQAWDGQGSQPDWLKLALTKEGYTVDELRVPLTSDSGSSEGQSDT